MVVRRGIFSAPHITDATLADLAEEYDGQTFLSAEVCPVCAGESRVAHAAFNINPGKPRRFDLRECARCKHGWIDPMPSQDLLNYLYNRGSYSVIGVGWAEVEDEYLTLPGQFVAARELRSHVGVGRYFELGVGKGTLYKRFLQSGWQCAGVEPGPWGRGLPGVNVDIEAVPQSADVDVIAALDVLEHVANPIQLLRTIRRLAAPHARLYCALPNRESARAIVGRARWRMMRPLGHVNYWSEDSVVRTFSRAGFTIEELRRTDLWQPRPPRRLRDVMAAAIEHFGFGDQWMLVARLAAQQHQPC